MPKRPTSTIRLADLQREHLTPAPQPWEDGARTPIGPRALPGAGFFERWNFEARLADGSTVAVVFFTRPLLESSNATIPGVSLTITRSDGKKLNEVNLVEPEEFSASKERCYVRCGPAWVREIDGVYELSVQAGRLSAHLTLRPLLPAWRPGSGRFDFDPEGKRYLAWLASVPLGQVEGQINYDGKLHRVQGIGYHDHRWGVSELTQALAQWIWGRVEAGEYTILFAQMTATEKYGRQVIPVFCVMRGSQILTEDGAPLRIEVLEYQPEQGGRSYPSSLDVTWESTSPAATLCLELRDPLLLDSFSLVDYLPAIQRIIGGLLVNPYSFRLESAATLTIQQGQQQTTAAGRAIFEVMLFQ